MIEILVAKTGAEKLFYLTQNFSRAELADLRMREQFFCPGCNGDMLLKIGETKIPHFAHKSLILCETFHEPESALHLKGKLNLHRFFHSKNHTVELEKYLPDIKQRADLLVNGQTAIEFQCSTIPRNQIIERSNGYRSLGIPVIWIGGIQQPLTEGIHSIKLKSYEAELRQTSGKFRFLLLFNPDSNRFYYCSSLFYVSGNHWIGKTKALSAIRQTFPFAVPKKLNWAEFKEMYNLFQTRKTHFVRNQLYARNRYKNMFWVLCYECGFTPRQLSEVVGVPFINADLISGHPMLWQLQVINAYKKGQSMQALVHSGRLSILPGSQLDDVEALLETYRCIFLHTEEQKIERSRLVEILYAIYCKTL